MSHALRLGEMMTALTVMLAALVAMPKAASAQVKVLISGGFGGAYQQLLPDFERSSGIKVETGSGASQGSGPQTIAAQLARGVSADVVIMSREGLSELIAANRIAEGTDVDLARVPLGVAVRAGAAKPDVSTVEAFKQSVTRAKTIAVPGSTGGIWLKTELFPRLGIADALELKMTPRGSEAGALVAAGQVALGVLPVSEIKVVPGVDLAGVLPSEIQLLQVFAAAIVAGSKETEGGKRLIDFLASPASADAIRNSGMEPVAKSR
jgi:molybdate transport system substrate-binding protein